jgi:hypothetical protein
LLTFLRKLRDQEGPNSSKANSCGIDTMNHQGPRIKLPLAS